MSQTISKTLLRSRFPVAIQVLILFAVLFGRGSAQYRFDQWTADNGLPQNSVYAIKQTRDGYLWLATLDGLVRFDGVDFQVFNKSNSPGIINNRFITLYESADGRIWAGTEESGVVRYWNGRFQSFGKESGLASLNVRQIYRLPNGDPLFHLDNNEPFVAIDDKFYPFRPEAGNAAVDSPESIFFHCQDGAESSQVKCLVNGRWQEIRIPNLLPGAVLHGVRAADGGLFLLDVGKQIYRLENGRAVPLDLKIPGGMLSPHRFVNGNGLYVLSKDVKENGWLTDLKTMEHVFLVDSKDFAISDIFTAYRDREGIIWLGSLRQGLFRVRRQVISVYRGETGPVENNVYPIFEDRHGTIWAGTTTGLYRFDGERLNLVESTRGMNIYSLGEGPTGRLLFSNFGEVFELDEGRAKKLYSAHVSSSTAIHTDRDNNLWIGTQDGIVRIRDGVSTVLTTRDGLAANIVKVIIDDRNGGIWIGSYGGLSHYRDGKFEKWTEAEGLGSLTIRSLYLDSDSVLWIGSYDGGLSRFKDGRFTHYTTQSGLYNDGAFQILEDEKQNFWISSNRGIYRVRKAELNEFAEGKRKNFASVAYGKSDGLLNVETNGGRSPGGIRARDGRLWFPTQDGAAVINPSQITGNPQEPPVIIEDLRIDDESIGIEKLAAGSGSPDARIEIQPGQQNFEIKYTALSFINSENLRFKYKLEGLTPDWVDAGTRRTAYFSYVPPGDYTFRVIAANSDGVWNETGRSLKITVLPPFYRTWWFLFLSVGILGGLGFLGYRRRISQLEREKKVQETLSRRLIELQENERKRLAGELHDSLSQNLVIIKNRAMMSLSDRENVEHAFEQIEEIAEAAVESLAEVREIAANLRPYQIDRLGLTKAVQSLIRKAVSPNLRIDSQIDEIDGLLPPEMQINLYRILQESLNNIIKHSQATEAAVQIERNEKTINIEIRDNGIGFDPGARKSNEPAGGFGLTGMTERARILGTVLRVESVPGNGTIIGFQINYSSDKDPKAA